MKPADTKAVETSEGSDERIPVAVWSGEIMGIRVCVLEDGRRLINAEDLSTLFERIGSGALDPAEFGEAFAQWRDGPVPSNSAANNTMVSEGFEGSESK